MTAAAGAAAPAPQTMLDLVRDALSIVCGRDESAVGPESDLEGLGVDSLGRVALAEIVEDRLSAQLPGLHIPDDDLTEFVTVDDVARYLASRR